MKQCCENTCNKKSTWFKGNIFSACDDHKEALEKSLVGYHIHSKCDGCDYEFCVDKLCESEGEHRFLCIICLAPKKEELK